MGIAVYMLVSFFHVCIADARVPPCHTSAPPFSAPQPQPQLHAADDLQASPFHSPEPADPPIPSVDFPDVDLAHPATVFDVTNYGAVGDGTTESSLAFLAAWEDACSNNGDSIVVIPEGTFFVGPISFNGPCYNKKSPKVNIRGTLKAPLSLKAFHEATWISFRNLHRIQVDGGGTLDAQGQEAWKLNDCHIKIKCNHPPRSLKFANVSSGIIRNIAILNSKGFHMSFLASKNIHVHDVNITSPWDSPITDGIHVSNSSNISIASSVIGVGDDCVSIGPGSIDISITNITCGPGHGISIGSLGKYPNEKDVRGVTVRNCTIKDTTNGVRIKTWPGGPPSKASNFTFEDIVMINVSNPIIIDQKYCPHYRCNKFKASLVKLSDISFKNIRGTSNTNPATTLLCSSAVPCENIQLVNVNLTNTMEDNNSQKASLSPVKKGVVHGIKVIDSTFSF